MPKPPPLTDYQKKTLRELEPLLRDYAASGNLKSAKKTAAKIQHLLKPTGHTTRWMQNKNWLAACALGAGDISFAIFHLNDVRTIMSEGTRTHIEATALLAICYIRRKRINHAIGLINSVLCRVDEIQSASRRHQFQKRFISRIEEECILAGLVGESTGKLDVDKIQEDAIELLKLNMDEQSLIMQLGNALPSGSIKLLEGVRSQALKQLPPVDRKCLPTTEQVKTPKELGKRVKAALKHVLWSALCDPNDELYQAWSSCLSVVYDKKMIAAAVAAQFVAWNIYVPILVVPVLALAFKMGVKVFCRTFAPDSIMISLSDKK